MNKKILSRMILAVSATLLAAGFHALEKYKLTPGESAHAPARLPASAGPVALAPDAPTLLIFAHPFCPCTEATLAELARLKARLKSQMHAKVILSLPAKLDSPEGGRVERRAREIPGVEVVLDPGQKITGSFGAVTSGQTMLYSASGALLFAGGITASRGHEGDNPGSEEIARLVQTHSLASKTETPVFGCKL